MNISTMQLNREYQKSNNKVCAYSYVKETDLPEGQKLLVCSKCQETCYKDRDAQVADWRIHKKTCCSLANDSKRIREGLGFSDLEECLQYIKTILDYPAGILSGRNLLYGLQQFRSYLLETDVYTGASDSRKRSIERMVAIMVIHPMTSIDEQAGPCQARKLIWSAPGFSNYFLSNAPFLSPRMSELKNNGSPPPPSEIFLDFGKVEPTSKIDPSFQFPLPYTKFLQRFGFLVAGVDLEEYPEVALLRPLRLARLKHALSCFVDPYSRLSLPVHVPGFETSDSLVYPFHRQISFWHLFSVGRDIFHPMLKVGEIFPGVSIKQFLLLLLEEESICFGEVPSWYSDQFYFELADMAEWQADYPEGDVWKGLSIDDRIELLSMFYEGWGGRDLNDKKMQDSSTCSYDSSLGETVLPLLLGTQTKTVLDMYHSTRNSTQTQTTNVVALELIERSWGTAMDYSMPLVEAYVQTIEPLYYRAQMEVFKSGSVSFPEDVMFLIAEYALLEDIRELHFHLERNIEGEDGDESERTFKRDGDCESESISDDLAKIKIEKG